MSMMCVSFVFVLTVTEAFSTREKSYTPPFCAVIVVEKALNAGWTTDTFVAFPNGNLIAYWPFVFVFAV